MIAIERMDRDRYRRPQSVCVGGCGRELQIEPPREFGRPLKAGTVIAFSEATDARGRTRYFCRECTEKMYRRG
jgi:hypothetical protein